MIEQIWYFLDSFHLYFFLPLVCALRGPEVVCLLCEHFPGVIETDVGSCLYRTPVTAQSMISTKLHLGEPVSLLYCLQSMEPQGNHTARNSQPTLDDNLPIAV